MDLNDLLALTLLAVLWLAITLALWRSLRGSEPAAGTHCPIGGATPAHRPAQPQCSRLAG